MGWRPPSILRPCLAAPASPGCPAASRASVFGFYAGAADHDLVLVDRDLDGPVARPVLGVDRVVGHGGIEPQPVALVAVVERALERGGLRACARASAAAAATA